MHACLVVERGPEQVVQIVKVCNDLDVPFLPRGAGTSLAGGCLPIGGGVMIGLARMKRILHVDYRNRYAVVEPGVVKASQWRPESDAEAATPTVLWAGVACKP